MTSKLKPFDIVRILDAIVEHDVPAGARAVILEVHEEPYLAYEVEVVDDEGRTLFVGAVDPAQVRLVTPSGGDRE